MKVYIVLLNIVTCVGYTSGHTSVSNVVVSTCFSSWLIRILSSIELTDLHVIY